MQTEVLRDGNGRPYKQSVIGHYIVTEPTEFCDRSFETASWYRKVLVEPGIYEARLVRDSWEDESWSLKGRIYVTLPGTVTDAFFPSSFGGVMYGDGHRPEQIGKAGDHHLSVDVYALARALLEDTEPPTGWARPWRMAPGIEPGTISFTSYDGQDHHTTGLFESTN